jgi:replicative DNA helicase
VPVASNVAPLDSVLGGGYRPGLHVLGGEPASGKSALGLFLAMMIARGGGNVLFCSLEMGAGTVWSRALSLCSLETGAPFGSSEVHELGLKAVATVPGERTPEALRAWGGAFNATDPVARAATVAQERYGGLVISEEPTAHEVRGLVDLLGRAAGAGADLAVIDYLQYVDVDGVADEYARVSQVSKALNRAAVALEMPVLALAAVARAANGKPPTMHGFKGTGDIEYHALSACVLTVPPENPNGARELHVVKNRYGRVTDSEAPIRLSFDGAHNSFAIPD